LLTVQINASTDKIHLYVKEQEQRSRTIITSFQMTELKQFGTTYLPDYATFTPGRKRGGGVRSLRASFDLLRTTLLWMAQLTQ
jgi:hypothetical protein